MQVPEQDLTPQPSAGYPTLLAGGAQACHVVTMLQERCKALALLRCFPHIHCPVARAAHEDVAEEHNVVHPVQVTFKGHLEPGGHIMDQVVRENGCVRA